MASLTSNGSTQNGQNQPEEGSNNASDEQRSENAA